MMDAIPPIVAVWSVWTVLAWSAVEMRSGVWRRVVVLGMLTTACSLVFWLWDQPQWLRGLSVIPVLLLLGKSWMIGARSISTLPQAPSLGAFVLWSVALLEDWRHVLSIGKVCSQPNSPEFRPVRLRSQVHRGLRSAH